MYAPVAIRSFSLILGIYPMDQHVLLAAPVVLYIQILKAWIEGGLLPDLSDPIGIYILVDFPLP